MRRSTDFNLCASSGEYSIEATHLPRLRVAVLVAGALSWVTLGVAAGKVEI